jgi:hypothetical protein
LTTTTITYGYAFTVGGTILDPTTAQYSVDTYAVDLQGTTGGAWTWTASTPFPTNAASPGIANQSCKFTPGYVYCAEVVGADEQQICHGRSGCTTEWVDQYDGAWTAPVSSSGIGAWHQTTSFPLTSVPTYGIGVSSAPTSTSCAITSSNIYCIIIKTANPSLSSWPCGTGNVYCQWGYYASASSGNIGGWSQTTSPQIHNQTGGLVDLESESCVADSSNYIYCIGGSHESYLSSSGQWIYATTGLVYYTTLSGGGAGSWSSVALPAGLSNLAFDDCQVNSGYVYCIGYSTTYDGTTGGQTRTPLDAVWYAPIGSGTIGTWKSASLPVQPDMCSVVNGYIYCMDYGSGNYYAAQITSGTIGAWTSGRMNNPSELIPGTIYAN